MNPTQSLPRALVLLALDGATGVLRKSSELHYAMITAALVELSRCGRLRRAGEALILADLTRSGDTMLDEIFVLLRLQARHTDLLMQIQHLAHSVSDLHTQVLANLEADGIVCRKRLRVFGSYQPQQYQLLQPEAQMKLRAQLRATIRFDPSPSDPMLALIALMRAFGMLDLVLSPYELNHLGARLSQLRPADTTAAWITAAAGRFFSESEVLALTLGTDC